MIIFTDRQFNTLALVDTDSSMILNDELNENIETGTAVFKTEIVKDHKDIERIDVGNFCFAVGYRNDPIALEVMEVFENRDTKEIIAEDAGLDLLNDDAEPSIFKGTLSEHIKKTIGEDSSWEVGLDEIGATKNLTLEYNSTTTQTKRISQIVGRFDAEVSYSFEFSGNVIKRKLINLHKKRGKDDGIRLEFGNELKEVRRHISITELCTAIKPIGQATEEKIIVDAPINLIDNGNLDIDTDRYILSEWNISEEIRSGEKVTITLKGEINNDRSYVVYNTDQNHILTTLQPNGNGIFSSTFEWKIPPSGGNNRLMIYHAPNLPEGNPKTKVDWVVLSKGTEIADKWIPSRGDESGKAEYKPTETETTVSVSNSSGKDDRIEKLIGWFRAREGKVGYCDTYPARLGPKCFDCSSSVMIASKEAGLIPKSAPTTNTAKMREWGNSGTYFHEIESSEVRRGDIFVSRSGGRGHTGVYLDNGNRIIHTTVGAGKRGVMETPAKGWLGAGVKYYRFNVLKQKTTSTMLVSSMSTSTAGTPVGTYWTNSEIIHHDIGKTLTGITADQLNNWIKAKSPSSVFNGNGNVFIEAQKQSGLDCRIILAHAAHESAWGSSRIAKKYHNYFGINAYDDNPDYARTFSNSGLASGIIGGAKWIAKNYYNSKYKQTTLYKMRYNNGVHQYATDPAWHTKIANIAKGSEKFTKPSVASSTPDSSQNVEIVTAGEAGKIEKTIQKETNLKGFKYDDGRYYVDEKKGTICDRESAKIWSRYKKGKEGYITKIYDSEATSQKTLFDEGLLQLQMNNEPKVTYDVDLSYLPAGLEIGDTVRIIDHKYKPALYLNARLIDITRSKSSPDMNIAVFSNIVEKESGISDKLIALQNMLYAQRWELENQPFTMEITSSNGNIFKDKVINTDLVATVRRAGIQQNSAIETFVWERVSAYPDKTIISDEQWNEEHLYITGNSLTVKSSDVDMEAYFTCSAVQDGVVVASEGYNIKDLTIGIYKQESEPDTSLLNWGDIWQWEGDKVPADGESLTIDEYQEKFSTDDIIPDTTYYIFESLKKPFKRIWKGDHWEDTVTKIDLEMIELTPGPPGADGKDGMPGEKGKDGRTSYVHFAYADSADGSIGFTKTATVGKKYIGMYTDFIEADSEDPSDYEWSLFKGADGQDGTDGIPGKAGADGKTPYFHQAWANSADGVTDFSTTISTDKIYIGTYVDFTKEDSEDPSKYKWIKVKGEPGLPGADGADGEDGKTGQLGSNLLIRSDEEKRNNDYLSGTWNISETLNDGEEVTVTLKADILEGRQVRIFQDDSVTELATLIKDVETGLYTSTFNWKVGGSNKLLRLYIGPDLNDENPPVDIKWITLQRGNISAIDWVPNIREVNDTINEKADSEVVNDIVNKQQELIVNFEQMPPSEEIRMSLIEQERQRGYLSALENAVNSNIMDLESRIEIIKANVGVGKLTIEAIETYFNFAEEGLLIGKGNESIKLRLKNDALEVTDSGKVVARFGNDFTETPNLKVYGTIEMGYHAISKLNVDGRKFTIFVGI